MVILSQVLPANSTIGYDDFSYLVVKKVNGKVINSLGDLAEAVKTPVDGFHVIETADDPKQLELDASEVAAEADALQKNYGLPALQRVAVSASGPPLFGAIFDWDGVIIDSGRAARAKLAPARARSSGKSIAAG